MFFPPRRHSEKNLVYSGGTSHPIRFRTVCESLSTAWKECPVSSKNDSEVSGKPKRGVSRRRFIRGAGIGGGVLSAGILDKKALAAPAAADKFVGPGAVPLTLNINGKSVYSCTVLAIDAQGKDIQTIEGISNGKPHPVSEAFVNNDAQQCGYCTPGFVMAAKAFLDHNPNPSYEEVKEGLCGNLCRCGTYVGVRQAVLEAAKEMKGGNHA